MSIDVFPATVLNSTLWNGQTYEEGTFTVTATGFTTVVTGTVVYRRAGQLVSIAFAGSISGTSNATTFTLTGIPDALAPARFGYYIIRVFNGSDSYGLLTLDPGNPTVWVLLGTNSGGPWVSSGLKNVSAQVITYPLASALAAPGWTGQSYEEGTFTVTATGFSGTAPSGTARYVRVGKQVTVVLPPVAGTSNSTTTTLTGLPVALRPEAAQNLEFMTRGGSDSTSHVATIVGINPIDGVIFLAPLPSLSWPATGNKFLAQTAITYLLA